MTDKEKEAKALELKEQGNLLFKIKNYEGAIEKYNQALTYCDSISVLHSNKARCYWELNDKQQCYKQAQKALKFDDKNIKAYFLEAECLVQIAQNSKNKTKIEEAIQKLKKSLRLCPSQKKGEFQEKFVEEIYKAKKKLWLMETEANESKMKALRSYLSGIVENDGSLSQDQKDSLHANIDTMVKKKFGSKQPIPAALICPLNKTLMKDPVCNEFGNSYSRKKYWAQITEKGKRDPLTGKDLKSGVMYPNVNLKKAIERFLDEHPWAYDEVAA